MSRFVLYLIIFPLLLFAFLIAPIKIYAQQYSTPYDIYGCNADPCNLPYFNSGCQLPGAYGSATRTGNYCCTREPPVGFGFVQCLNTNDIYAPDGSSSYHDIYCDTTPSRYHDFQCYTPPPTPVPPTATPIPSPTPTPTPIPTYTISGNVFVDKNRNGAVDAGEGPYVNATVSLSGTATDSTTTNASGIYSFFSLSTGNYTVTLTVPFGYEKTTTNPAANQSLPPI